MAPDLEQLEAGETYEQHAARDWEWAMSEADEFFQGRGLVQKSLHDIAARLNELNIPYAVVGGLALGAHGFRRYTEDVDILVTQESLTRIHAELDGLGYIPPFPGSRHLRDASTKVKIEFLVTGGFPGDGKPKPVAFPDPSGHTINVRGIEYLQLPRFIELKIASGLTASHRLKDLADIQELAKVIGLTAEFAPLLNPYVRDKFLELVDTPSDMHGKD